MPEHRRLVLLRHGQTAWNLEGRAQGHTDIELDETGLRQAATVAPYVAALAPVTLWSSDLVRAAHTAAYVGSACGLEVRTDPRLREFGLGERTGLTMAEYAAAYPEEHAAFAAGRIEVTPGGETNAEVVARVTEVLGEVLAGIEPGQTAVVVSHGGALKTALVSLLGWSDDVWPSFYGLFNCHWAVLEDSREGGALRLVQWNVGAPHDAVPGEDDPEFATGEGVG